MVESESEMINRQEDTVYNHLDVGPDCYRLAIQRSRSFD